MNIKNSKSVICIDLGKKRLGIAGCDPLGISITQLPAIIRTNIHEDIQKISDICHSRRVIGLIFGLPLDKKGNQTIQSIHYLKEGIRIATSIKLPYVFINEHLSTWEAKDKFNLKKDKTGKLDSAAAAIILEQWLKEGPKLKPTI